MLSLLDLCEILHKSREHSSSAAIHSPGGGLAVSAH
jgi:hypothetical protein